MREEEVKALRKLVGIEQKYRPKSYRLEIKSRGSGARRRKILCFHVPFRRADVENPYFGEIKKADWANVHRQKYFREYVRSSELHDYVTRIQRRFVESVVSAHLSIEFPMPLHDVSPSIRKELERRVTEQLTVVQGPRKTVFEFPLDAHPPELLERVGQFIQAHLHPKDRVRIN